MRRILATVLAVTAIIAAGCAGESDDAGESPPATPAAEASAPTTTATAPTTDATSDSAGGQTSSTAPEPAPEPAATPAPTPDGDAEAHPSDTYFALERVLDISIEIDGEDWDTLRHQTRTFADVIAEITEYGLSRPFADIYDWFSATVTVDGETHADVGVRKKGFLGSQSDTKPALKLRFDKYVDDQSLGGVMERMTLNNSVQDPSMVNTCLSYRVFAAAGSPAPRCNFATVSVNGKDLGLYVHVEEIKAPFLSRHFESAAGNLYEGTVSDFTPEYRGTIEKKTNEDAADWSDIDAVVAAVGDPTDAGLEALGEIVDLNRFLSFWATEVLVGHWDGYAGDRNNYHFYREPNGPFVFIPWGPDDTFHLKDDPNPFDNIGNPPPSVLALTAIPNRLYNNPDWRVKYAARLTEILDTVWVEDELLAAVDDMAAIVQQHALPFETEAAANDTERVRKFILKRRGEILADLTPTPPDWPEPAYIPPSAQSGTLEITFQTTWGSNLSPNPLQNGTIDSLLLNGSEESTESMGVFSGYSSPQESVLLPRVDKLASIVAAELNDDGSVSGMTLAVDLDLLAAGATLVIGADNIAGGIWSIPPGASVPEEFSPFTEGVLELSTAGTTPGAAIAGTFSGVYGYSVSPSGGDAPDDSGTDPGTVPVDVGLVINEVAAKGDPLDWFELHNPSPDPIALDGFEVADSLTDAGKRVAFPAGTTIGPGAYMQIRLDKDAWPGFALGGDEELGIWRLDGTHVDSVDWNEGQSAEGQSYARVPDATGDFQTVDNPTPGAANQP
ncbi:CotH kinase family protein [Candidatus Poriferisodalis sp.]|uniref:CotH kinase family protein n=1 Tax=Candidatus Poriferisodalis sp. TaxID=3101277 RepID=UPI003B02A532